MSAWSFKRVKPRVPDGIRIYAVGDIHGRADLVEQLFNRIDTDFQNDPCPRKIEVYLGDYIDRGTNSRAVLDLLLSRKQTHETVFLKGNHETYLLRFLSDPSTLTEWQRLGGLETLMSYGIAPHFHADAVVQAQFAMALSEALPAAHRKFLRSLPLTFTCGDFFFVHAGIRPGVPFNLQKASDLLHIRNDFLLSEKNFGKIVVHGHTPVSQADFRSNRINIDTGAFATGWLTCLKIEKDSLECLDE